MADISQKGLDLIKKWEGFSPHAYDDGEGVWTIGYGTTRWDMKTPVRKGETITLDEAERQLRKECQRVEDAIDRAIKVPLNACEYDAICSFGYNVGIGWITGEGHQQATFIKQLNKGNRAAVPAGLLQFVRGANSGKAYEGLLNRRKDEVRLWLTPPDDTRIVATEPVDAPMPQAVEPARPGAIAVVKESPTIWASIVAFVMTIGNGVQQSYEWVFGVAKEAGPEVLALKTTFSPFDALFKLTGPVLLILTATCLAYVISRRISKG